MEKEGAEVVLPDFMGFVKYVAANGVISHQLLKNNGLKSMLFDVAIKLINSFEKVQQIVQKIEFGILQNRKIPESPCKITKFQV